MQVTSESTIKGLKKLSEWQKLFAKPEGELYDKLVEIYGNDAEFIAQRTSVWQDALNNAAEFYGADDEVFLSRAGGRINLLGMHVDHRGGHVNPISIGDVIYVVKPRSDDVVVMRNSDEKFPERQFSIRDLLPNEKVTDWDVWTMAEFRKRQEEGTAADWSNYVRAPIVYLQFLLTDEGGNFKPALRGMEVFVHGALPIAAGLSSSSAIVVGMADAILNVNGVEVTQSEYIDLCAIGEWYVGTRGGGGDHAAIKYCQSNHIGHLGSHPLTVDVAPFPDTHAVILCNSHVTANKTAGAHNFYNSRVACYEIGMMLFKKRCPEFGSKITHWRDMQPQLIGADDATVLEALKCLPDPISREDILAELPEERERLDKIFASHDEPENGYEVRRVCLYGVSECLRSSMVPERLEAGDIDGFGEIISVAHDGDRVSVMNGGDRVRIENHLSDDDYDQLIANLRSGDEEKARDAALWLQPGGYNASVDEIDELVDLALQVEGVAGAGLTGAGLGGCMIVLVEKAHAQKAVDLLTENYYKARGLEPAARICIPTGGANVLDLGA